MLKRPLRVRSALGGLLACLLATTSWPVFAEQEWQPFRERDQKAAAQRSRAATAREQGFPEAPSTPDFPAPQGAAPVPFVPPPAGKVERVELPPLPGAVAVEAPAARAVDAPATMMGAPATTVQDEPVARSALGGDSARDGRPRPPLPDDLWRGLDMRSLEALIQPLDVPPRSVALHALWLKLLTSDVTAPGGGRGPSHFSALRLEALYRSGLIGQMQAQLQDARGNDDPLMMAFRTRRSLAAADTDGACAQLKQLTAMRDRMPKALKGEAHILGGYCAAVSGNPAAAGLAAELAREEEVDAPLALQTLDLIAAQQGAGGGRAKIAMPKRLMVLDYRLMELAARPDAVQVLTAAEPALLFALSQTEGTEAKLAIAAAEAAAGLNALTARQLSDVYRRVASGGAEGDPLFRRAQLYNSLVSERQPQRRLQIARQMLDDARRSGLGTVIARVIAGELGSVPPTADLGPLAVVGAEVHIAAGNYDLARRFAAINAQAAIWAPLAELADPTLKGVSDSALVVLEAAVQRGAFKPDQLHRLATVLDALDTNIPIPLWEAASRTPQPSSGHLPETGVLPQLLDASKRREIGRTALLVMRAVGSQGPDATHLIALGDSIRALRRAGLDAEARLLAMEALFASWPRG